MKAIMDNGQEINEVRIYSYQDLELAISERFNFAWYTLAQEPNGQYVATSKYGETLNVKVVL